MVAEHHHMHHKSAQRKSECLGCRLEAAQALKRATCDRYAIRTWLLFFWDRGLKFFKVEHFDLSQPYQVLKAATAQEALAAIADFWGCDVAELTATEIPAANSTEALALARLHK